jgi:hypothetical protein
MEMHQYYQDKYSKIEPLDKVLELPEGQPITVYSDYLKILDFLKDPRF